MFKVNEMINMDIYFAPLGPDDLKSLYFQSRINPSMGLMVAIRMANTLPMEKFKLILCGT